MQDVFFSRCAGGNSVERQKEILPKNNAISIVSLEIRSQNQVKAQSLKLRMQKMLSFIV